MGSSNYITNFEGQVSQHMEYFAFGESFVEEHKNSHNSPYKFNGKELDEETGLYYYGARYYNPRTSIWLSVDPLANVDYLMNNEAYLNGEHNGGVFNHFNLNSYGYCYGNPIRYFDPNGKQVDMNRGINQGMYIFKGKTPEERGRRFEQTQAANKAEAAGAIIGTSIWCGFGAVATWGWRTIGTFFAKEAAEEGLSQLTGGLYDYLDLTKIIIKGGKQILKTTLKSVRKKYDNAGFKVLKETEDNVIYEVPKADGTGTFYSRLQKGSPNGNEYTKNDRIVNTRNNGDINNKDYVNPDVSNIITPGKPGGPSKAEKRLKGHIHIE